MPGTSARAANTWLITCTRQLTSQSASEALSCPLRDSPALEKNTSTGPYLSSAAAISALMSVLLADVAGDGEPVDLAARLLQAGRARS